MELKTIQHGTRGYEQMIELRMELLRRPLGLSFTPEQLANEKDDWHIGAFENEEIIGCCVLTPHNTHMIQLRQMAVRENKQTSGIGKAILAFAEKTAIKKGFSILMMHARKPAIGFYQKCGYQIKGDEFTEVGIPHYYMEKKLDNS